MTAGKRIGILTGGGDVPGLNSVIKSVVYKGVEMGYEVLGVRRGWEGLTHMRPGQKLEKLRLVVPEGQGKQAEVLGEGAAAAPRVVEVLQSLGVA